MSTDHDQHLFLTSHDAGVSFNEDDPRPFMTFHDGKAHYWVSILESLDATGQRRKDVELPAEAYRDVVSTLALDLRHEVLTLLGNIDHDAVGRLVDHASSER